MITETAKSNIALFITIPLISLFIIGALTWYLYRLKKAREARLRLRLTDEEIIEFEQGATGPPALNEPWNLPYQREYEIAKNELSIRKPEEERLFNLSIPLVCIYI